MKNDGFDKFRNKKKLRTKNEILGMKYAKRRKALKKISDPTIALARKFKKASKLAKAGIIGAAILPKAILVGAGYAGAKSANEKEKPKKYMTG